MSLSCPQLALVAAALVLDGLSARADDTPTAGAPVVAAVAKPALFDIGVAGGTAGVGAQVSVQLLPPSLALRAVANGLSIDHDASPTASTTRASSS